MKLLISAYACAPNRGSEHGSAWNWTSEAARLGEDVTVLVSPAHRDAILAATERDPALQRIRWLFPEVAFWPLQQGKEPVWERTYNLLWQREALRVARALHREQPFDLVHHLTWGGVRAPTFLGTLGAPLIIGPVGGGETSPAGLRDRMPLRGRVLESVRDLSNATIELNPIVRQGLRKAGVIFARTADTKNLLSPPLRAKTYVQMELGVMPTQIGAPRPVRQAPRKLLYAGRLLYWKGVHIAVEAMAQLVANMPDAQLTIVGNGPEEARLKTEIAQRGLGANITFVSWMPQEQFLRLYDTHDLFVFPSLHDSTGWVVLSLSAKDCQSLASISVDRRTSSPRSAELSSIRRALIHRALRPGWPRSCVCSLPIQNGLPRYRRGLSRGWASFFCAIRSSAFMLRQWNTCGCDRVTRAMVAGCWGNAAQPGAN